MNSKTLDQFYTNTKVSDDLVNLVIEILKNEYKLDDLNFIEPSAGTGSFIESLRKNNIVKNVLAYDIEPKHEKVIKQDFLSTNINYSKNNIVIGNPPFGSRAKLAINFLNKSLEISDFVGFILPIQFERYLTQKKINANAALIESFALPKYSFIHNNKETHINCVFQIWTKNNFIKNFKNLRLLKPLPRKHNDFEIFLYNCTPQTFKYFDKNMYKWDFAVLRQGYGDYSKKITNPNELNKKRQYIFIKSKNEIILERLNNIDLILLKLFSPSKFINFSCVIKL